MPWRFNPKEPGATLGKFEDPNLPAEMDNYYRLRHVIRRGTSGHVAQAGPFGDHADYCRLIYFVGRPVVGREFWHAFNLNVEFVFDDGPNGEINTLPIVIDPDVRYPGGSGA